MLSQCHLSVSISASCHCSSMPPAIAASMPHFSAYQCTSMLHISAHLSCLSVSPISASQCHLSMPVSAPISATSQCHLSMPSQCPISAA
ncbi:unnamed protein product [Staurois parvus]|uniref:Uncharacterized protein n=1 Tax=Staurois parvus TaxID=386267 RepID=A0ABN9B5F1_9NEOB|nr:unnamed protein product [Staurois parvus]